MTRYDIRAILADPCLRKRLIVGTCIALQAREGVDTTPEQMADAYDRVQAER